MTVDGGWSSPSRYKCQRASDPDVWPHLAGKLAAGHVPPRRRRARRVPQRPQGGLRQTRDRSAPAPRPALIRQRADPFEGCLPTSPVGADPVERVFSRPHPCTPTPSRGVSPQATWEPTPSRGCFFALIHENRPLRGVFPHAARGNRPSQGAPRPPPAGTCPSPPRRKATTDRSTLARFSRSSSRSDGLSALGRAAMPLSASMSSASARRRSRPRPG